MGFEFSRGKIVKYIEEPGVKEIIIPNFIIRICNRAFEGCRNITSIIIPDSVYFIGDYAFDSCTKLKSIKISNNVTIIGNHAFCRCESLTSVIIPDSVTRIEDYAFYNCLKLKSVIIPESVTYIGNEAFSECKNLTSVTMSEEKFLAFNLKKIFNYGDGRSYPPGILKYIYNNITDVQLRDNIKLNWKKLDPSVQLEIFMNKQSKAVISGYIQANKKTESTELGKGILNILSGNPTTKECCIAASFISIFIMDYDISILNDIYSKLKELKNGKNAVAEIEKSPDIMIKLGNTSTENTSSFNLAENTVAKKTAVSQIETTLKEFYNIEFKDLPEIKDTDENVLAPFVLAWLLAEHEKLCKADDEMTRIDVEVKYRKAGISTEAEEVLKLIDNSSLQNALLEIGNKYLGNVGYNKKNFLAYPIMRYANEDVAREFVKKASEWCSSVSGNDAPPLYHFRKASLYSNTIAAMLLADKYHELDTYAKIHGTNEDSIRDKYLSDSGLDKDGRKAYDLGNQIVIANLQPDMSFLFELPTGKTAKSLPKKGADPEKYEAAKADFAELKKNARKILTNRFNRLFEDFLSGRKRPSEDWQKAYFNNPLLFRAAKLVVWVQGKKTFVLSDNGAVDSKESSYTIGKGTISVAHPMDMAADDIKRWQKYFTKHGLKQPFAQIWEPIHKPENVRSNRYEGFVADIGSLWYLDRHGIHEYGVYEYSENFGIKLDECKLEYESSTWRYVTDGSEELTYTFGMFSFPKFTRQVNHIVNVLDNITIEQLFERRVADDEVVTVMDRVKDMTLAQVMKYMAIAQEKEANNVLAALMDYKNKTYPDYNAMDDFVLDW